MIRRMDARALVLTLAVSLLILPRITVATISPGMLGDYGRSAASVSSNYYLTRSLEGFGGSAALSWDGIIDFGVTVDRSVIERSIEGSGRVYYGPRWPIIGPELLPSGTYDTGGPVAYANERHESIAALRIAPSIAFHFRLPNRMLNLMLTGSREWTDFEDPKGSTWRIDRSGVGYGLGATLYRLFDLSARASFIPYLGVEHRRGEYREHGTIRVHPIVPDTYYKEKSSVTSLHVGMHLAVGMPGGAVSVSPSFEFELIGGRRAAALEIGYVLRSGEPSR